jgi:hypothetical protein
LTLVYAPQPTVVADQGALVCEPSLGVIEVVAGKGLAPDGSAFDEPSFRMVRATVVQAGGAVRRR